MSRLVELECWLRSRGWWSCSATARCSVSNSLTFNPDSDSSQLFRFMGTFPAPKCITFSAIRLRKSHRCHHFLLRVRSLGLDGIYPARGTNHLQLLNRFSLHPLELKRIIMHLKFLYGLLHNQIDSIALLESVNLRVPFFQSRSQLTFTYKIPRINAISRTILVLAQIGRYYIPHQAVVKESSTTTKLRVVFVASCKTTNGISLNDCMLTGLRLQQDLLNILLRWRYKIAVSAAYGTASAPYIAVRTMQQLARDEKPKFPVASEDFYVDDLLSGTDSEEFNVKERSSNNFGILQHLPLKDETALEVKMDDVKKSLRLQHRILEAHANVKDLSLIEAKINYIKAWQLLPDFGISFFVVKFMDSKKEELLGVGYNRIMKMDINTGDHQKTWRFNTMKAWNVNWEIKHMMVQFEEGNIIFSCLSADCKVVHEFIGGYIFLSTRSKDASQTLNEELFHKLTGGWS
ncbi:unnamed protein product [Brassicogethes aeneus]|uniref:FERM central domain-containing protein n=1 Tax=Brassicogethes aeneus TaxID=1431903 RepID=A0A9P0FET9_BRAAE|nr:unnamed protein product [Brassicogethes aeneus]